MKAKELRIGNLVRDKESGVVMITEHISPTDSRKRLGFTAFYDCDILPRKVVSEPIALTEEWLLKFGYVKIKNDWQGKFHRINELSKGLFTCDKNGVVLKRVHQLQNLYFALTGEELEIEH